MRRGRYVDVDDAVNPAASEVAGDERDQNCDGGEDCYVDVDDDGYTSVGGATVESADLLCDGAGEATDLASGGDCDDASAAYNPGAIEDACPPSRPGPLVARRRQRRRRAAPVRKGY